MQSQTLVALDHNAESNLVGYDKQCRVKFKGPWVTFWGMYDDVESNIEDTNAEGGGSQTLRAMDDNAESNFVLYEWIAESNFACY
jgi:hypothetical protein